MADNEEMLEKAGELTGSSTGAMTYGGLLNNKQQTKFLEYLRAYGNLLGRVRFVRMTQATQEIDKIHLGEPVTTGATEATNDYAVGTNGAYINAPNHPYRVVPKFNKIRLTARKVRSAWALTPESLQNNIAGNSLESTVMNMITERMAHDMEEMALNGDTSTTITGSSLDAPLNHLRSLMNGWDALSNDAIILDVNGSFISKDIWNDMVRITPKEHKSDSGRVWICSDNVAQDWVQILQERVGGIGDMALRGEGIAPLGIPMIRSSILRDDKPLTTTIGTIAKVVSGHFGPYHIPGSVRQTSSDTTDTANALEYRMEVVVDGGSARIIGLPGGVWDTNQMVSFLTPLNGFGDTSSTRSKSVWVGNTEYFARFYSTSTSSTTWAALDADWRVAELGDGRLVVYSVAASSPSIDFNTLTNAGTYTDVSRILGFSSSTSNTNDAPANWAADTSSTTNPEGSVIMLVNPRNLIWGVLDGTRIFTEYNKDVDVIESVIYNQVACAIEDTRGIVKAINVRAQNGWPV